MSSNVKALRDALRPFAEAYARMLETAREMQLVDENGDWSMPDDKIVDPDVWAEARMTFDDFERAAEVLKAGEQDD